MPGQRGLAGVAFGIIVLDTNLPGGGTVAVTVVCAIVLSIILHGVTANPLVAAFARVSRREGGGSMSKGGPTTRHVTEKNNFAYLAVALVLLLFGLALSQEFGVVLGQIAVEAALMAVLVAGVWSMRGDYRWYSTRLGLLAAVLLLFAVRLWVTHAGFDLVWLGILNVYLVLTTWSAMRLVLFSGPVDWNKIVGSFCIYLLLGIVWATLFMMLAAYRPGAFNGLPGSSWEETYPNLLQFSYITLTTVGYGNVTPVSPLANFLASMEAIIGQFYLTVLVASLVGSVLSNRQK